MNYSFSKHKSIYISVLVFLSISAIYSLTAQKLYLSTSKAAIFRHKIEDPDKGTEETRNRWIWIRDGLNFKSALVTDDIIKDFIQNNAKAKELSQKFKNQNLAIEYFQKLITVQFTGADENNYIIEVKGPDAQLAYDLNSLVFERLRYFAIQMNQKNYENLISKLNQELLSLNPSTSEYSFIQNKIMKLKFEFSLEQAQRETSFQIISAPSINETPIWPKFSSNVLIGLLLGFFVGLLIEYLQIVKKV